MTSAPQSSSAPLHWLVFVIAGIKLGLHLLTNLLGGYGYFRDELYYLACSEHLDFGYVDHPPLSILVLFLSRSLFGDSLFALRLIPALAGACTVLVTALIARRMNGRKTAQVMSALAATVSPVYMGMNSFFSMNSLDILFWAMSFLVLLRILADPRMSDWLALGLIIGLGSLNKISMIFPALGIAAVFLLTEHRRILKTPLPWMTAGISLVLFLPYVIWNIQHDFAHLEFIRNASAGKYSALTPLGFLKDQFLFNNPWSAGLWALGIAFFFTRAGRPYRPAGIAFGVVLLILLLNRTSKPEYLAPGIVLLFAAGGVFCEQFLNGPRLVWLRRFMMTSLVAGVSIIPLGLPILPVQSFIRYADALGVQPMTAENIVLAELPQFYGDMFGWEEQVKALAVAYHTLSEEEKKVAVVFGFNYGRAGAVDFFGPQYGLPPAISGHNNYWIWGPGRSDASVVLLLSSEIGPLRERFEEVTEVGFHSTRYALPYENNLRVYVCRNLKGNLTDLWRELKHYQ
ncbi:MAG: glycosyltransferase family 39 protein [Ignavibacteria bacterium]|nr:glycosyltransferase family 39 protein [Ignavibacteria bacterium]